MTKTFYKHNNEIVKVNYNNHEEYHFIELNDLGYQGKAISTALSDEAVHLALYNRVVRVAVYGQIFRVENLTSHDLEDLISEAFTLTLDILSTGGLKRWNDEKIHNIIKTSVRRVSYRIEGIQLSEIKNSDHTPPKEDDGTSQYEFVDIAYMKQQEEKKAEARYTEMLTERHYNNLIAWIVDSHTTKGVNNIIDTVHRIKNDVPMVDSSKRKAWQRLKQKLEKQATEQGYKYLSNFLKYYKPQREAYTVAEDVYYNMEETNEWKDAYIKYKIEWLEEEEV